MTALSRSSCTVSKPTSAASLSPCSKFQVRRHLISSRACVGMCVCVGVGVGWGGREGLGLDDFLRRV
jgi:hypothetical protein